MLWTTSAGQLKAIADTLKDILTECWFEFTENKIVLLNVDPEKVVTVYMEIRPTAEDYQCLHSINFATYIQLIYKVLRGSKADEIAVLSADDNSNLCIQIKTPNNHNKMVINLKSLEGQACKYSIPVQFADMELSFNSSNLYYLLHDLGAISRTFNISVNNNQITFDAVDEAGTKLTFSESRNISGPPYRAAFITKYLEKFLKPKLCKFVTLRLRNDAPISAVYHLQNGFLEMTMAQLE